MTEPTTDAVRQLAVAVGDQNRALEEVTKAISYLKGSESRSRNFLRLLAVTLVFDICLSVVLGAVAIRSNDAADRAHQATKAACTSSNEIRANEVQLWNYILDVSSQNQPQNQPPLTEDQKAKQEQLLNQFRAKITSTFVPRDCSKI